MRTLRMKSTSNPNTQTLASMDKLPFTFLVSGLMEGSGSCCANEVVRLSLHSDQLEYSDLGIVKLTRTSLCPPVLKIPYASISNLSYTNFLEPL